MWAGDLGSWAPLSVAATCEVFRDAQFRWFLTGGYALELALGGSWRPHEDLDVGLCRSDIRAVYQHLHGWQLFVAAAGILSPWDGRPLSVERHENNVWARRSVDGPWVFDITVGGGDTDVWWSRRDPAIRLPWTEAVEHPGGIPYLAPHAQLLMKAKAPRPKDHLDAEVVIPALDAAQRRWLAGHLPDEHPWLGLMNR
jgi:hypothetical protein